MNLYNFESKLPPQRYYILNAIEENKTLNVGERIIDELIKMDSKKKTTLIAIGGGIVQDLTCFIASILYRGIDWVLVPTTLLAQTDSCIGSKSSINYKKYKNLIGTFYPPSEIVNCMQFLKTLSKRDYFSGLGEIVKIQLMISKSNFYDFKENLDKIIDRDYTELLRFIKRTLEYKKKLIELDEFDTGIRNTLNFGHTFGHAIESATHYYVPHGQAVSIGILIANRISIQQRLIDNMYEMEIQNCIQKIISPEYQISSVYNVDLILDSMKMDKKFTGSHNCILLTESNGAKMYSEIDENLIRTAMNYVFKDIFHQN